MKSETWSIHIAECNSFNDAATNKSIEAAIAQLEIDEKMKMEVVQDVIQHQKCLPNGEIIALRSVYFLPVS